jgi:hypothetical protein
MSAREESNKKDNYASNAGADDALANESEMIIKEI